MPPFSDVLRSRTHTLISSLNSHRLLLYTLLSFLAVSAAITNALRSYSNFYSLAISLSKSNRSVLALANFGFLLSLLCGHVVQKIFFGTLRANEVERLYDRLWFFITESLLAFTIFRDEFDIPFAVMFGFLLFVKSFHWLAGDRIEWMDQRPYPGPPPLFHFRMVTLFVILWLTDFLMFLVAVENTIAHGVGGMVLFASEYGILMASVLNTISKYLLSAYELRRAGRRGGENAPPWESKSMWVFYIELATDFLKLTTYLVFFTIIITFYGLPLNIVRDVYITARSFITRLRALHRYQSATRNMDQRYPNATREELDAMTDHTCIICREDMVLNELQRPDETHASDGPNTTPKKLPCGHIFHFHCLRSWLERQQSCPTCRRTVLDSEPRNGDTAAPGAVPAQGEPPPANDPNELVQNQDNGRANNPLGNPFGLVGRLFGPPPIIPGQPAAQIPPAQINAPQDPGNLAVQLPQGVVVQYHIQYQMPRNQQQNEQPSAQPLQPPPQLRGFHGPGGAWQQWPLHPVPPQDPQLANLTPQTQNVNSQPENATIPRVAPTTPNHNATPSTTPREEAASAALRRMSNTSGYASRSSETTASQHIPSVHSGTPAGENSRTPTAANDTTSNQMTGNAPRLVPLYDYSAITNVTIPAHPQTPSAYTGEPHVHVSRGLAGPSRLSTRAPQQPPQRRSHTPGSSLPPTLTDEQLAVMDRLTREAIDERLRVLEGVSGAIFRCVDDLMRVRSALPPSTSNPIESPARSAHVKNEGSIHLAPSGKQFGSKEELPISGENGLVNGGGSSSAHVSNLPETSSSPADDT